MKIIIPACFILYVSIHSVSAQTGFFLKMDNKASCSLIVTSVDSKNEFCITPEPVINESEFKVEDSLQFNPSHSDIYFNIRFTKTGFETLKMICDFMPEKDLLLVVKGKTITLTNKSQPRQVIRISGPSDSKEIRWVFENLKKK
jgi:hypothetical protein